MTPSWLDKYPRAAAMLQGEDDVLEYEPDGAEPPTDPADTGGWSGGPLRRGDAYTIGGVYDAEGHLRVFLSDPEGS